MAFYGYKVPRLFVRGAVVPDRTPENIAVRHSLWEEDMSAALAAKMIDPIRDVLRSPVDAELCATFEVVAHDDIWVQVTRDAINMAYPLVDDPHGRLSTLADSPPCDGILAWEPEEYVTFSYRSKDPAEVADRVEALFREIFSCAGCSVVGRIESL